MRVTDGAVDTISSEGFDPVYGARPLRRAIQSKIEDPLAEKLLEGGFQSGDTITVDVSDGVFTFSKAETDTLAAGKDVSPTENQ